MIVRKGHVFRLKTTPDIEGRLCRMGGCARFVWNKALATQKERLEAGKSVQGYAALCADLKVWKETEDTAFLAEAHSQVLQQKLKDLRRAFDDYFDPEQLDKQFPRFKKKTDAADSFRYPQGVRIDNRRIFLPKVGWVGLFKSREVEGKIKNVTVRQRGDRWFVSIQTEQEVLDPVCESTSIAGIDLGVIRLLTATDGKIAEPVHAYRAAEASLAREQKKLARKQKGSANFGKTHAVVVAEDLRVKAMTASAHGTMESPGRHVRQKAALNKAILDQGWGELVRQLGYKLRWWGGELVLVPAGYTSQCCSRCGHIAAENRRSQVLFSCVACGHRANADENAAENIRRVGQTRMACGSSPVGGRKQEPAGTREEVPPRITARPGNLGPLGAERMSKAQRWYVQLLAVLLDHAAGVEHRGHCLNGCLHHLNEPVGDPVLFPRVVQGDNGLLQQAVH